MNPISSTAPRPVSPPAVQSGERPREPRPAPASAGSPVQDEYVPEEKRESYGRYWLGKDEDGSPKIFFDGPEAAEPPESDAPEEDPPEKEAPSGRGREEKRCTSNTDKVDREIERLRKKKENLERRLSSEEDEAKREQLERQLSQTESELRQKDNDAYRRRHAVFTEG